MKAEIWNYNNWIAITDPDTLKEIYGRIIKECGFKVLGEIEYMFNPQGFTKLWLLGESHFAVHTFPEEQKTYIELSSCNERMYNTFISLCEAREKNGK